MHEFRLLKTGHADAAFNMGLDEAILESVSAGRVPPTLRFYGWTPSAVSIGYFQGLHEEVDVAACAERGVHVVRRITGGGAVFHQAELTYSIVVPEGHPLAPASIMESYRGLCGAIVSSLALLGVEASFAPINDILSGGRKISGNAQTRKRRCLLQHGTILLDVDVDTMFDLLRVPSEKAKGKLIQDVKARVTSLSAILGRPVSFAEVEDALERGLQAALDLSLRTEAPTAVELDRAGTIAAEKFADPSWTGRR